VDELCVGHQLEFVILGTDDDLDEFAKPLCRLNRTYCARMAKASVGNVLETVGFFILTAPNALLRAVLGLVVICLLEAAHLVEWLVALAVKVYWVLAACITTVDSEEFAPATTDEREDFTLENQALYRKLHECRSSKERLHANLTSKIGEEDFYKCAHALRCACAIALAHSFG
jgi:hypothetical protein